MLTGRKKHVKNRAKCRRIDAGEARDWRRWGRRLRHRAGRRRAPMRILLVEDDDDIAEPLLIGLRREGFDVSRASSAAEALLAPPH